MLPNVFFLLYAYDRKELIEVIIAIKKQKHICLYHNHLTCFADNKCFSLPLNIEFVPYLKNIKPFVMIFIIINCFLMQNQATFKIVFLPFCRSGVCRSPPLAACPTESQTNLFLTALKEVVHGSKERIQGWQPIQAQVPTSVERKQSAMENFTHRPNIQHILQGRAPPHEKISN